MEARFDIKEIWLWGDSNNIGPFPSFDKAVETAGQRLRGYKHNAPSHALVYENGVEIAKVRVAEDRTQQKQGGH